MKRADVTQIPPAPDLEDDAAEAHLPEAHWPLPELTTITPHPHPPVNKYVEAHASDDFVHLRRSFRAFAFPTVAAVLVWYLTYVLLSTYVVEFMGRPFLGNLTVGMAIGLLQFPTTWLATWAYLRHMRRRVDPLATGIRVALESQEG